MPPITALTELPDVDGRVIRCPAATMIAGELRRRELPAVSGVPLRRTGTVLTAVVATTGGAAAGLGVAVPPVGTRSC